jgi:hypothetical protein
MGCCAIRLPKTAKSAVTTASSTRELSFQREELLSKIFFLHNLILTCNNQIETFLINDKKDLAFLLKSKKFCIKEKSKDLQNLISRIDEHLEENPQNKNERREIRAQVFLVSKELENNPIFEENVDLEEKSQDYLQNLRIAIQAFDVNEEIIEKEIQLEMNEYKKKTDERGTVVRRKYVKARKTA